MRILRKSTGLEETEGRSDLFLKYIFLFLLASVIGRIYEFDLTLSTGSLDYLKHFPTAIYTLIFAFPYGVAGVLLFMTARFMDRSLSFKNRTILKVLICVAVVDLVELAAGLFTVKVMGVMPWDYTHHFMNYKGLISLPITIRWLIFVLILGAFAYQPAQRFIEKPIPRKIRRITVGILVFYGVYLVVILMLKRFGVI